MFASPLRVAPGVLRAVRDAEVWFGEYFERAAARV